MHAGLDRRWGWVDAGIISLAVGCALPLVWSLTITGRWTLARWQRCRHGGEECGACGAQR